MSNGKQVVLLQTAQAVVVNGRDNAISVRILLGNGSQLSYMTTALQSRLNLKPIRKEKLHLNTFGNENFTTRCCKVASAKTRAFRNHRNNSLYRIRWNIQWGKLSRFVNNIHYVGKTFAVCPRSPILECANYKAGKLSMVKHLRLAENRESFPPQTFYRIRYVSSYMLKFTYSN